MSKVNISVKEVISVLRQCHQSAWNERLANVPKACESVCCICVRGSFLFQKLRTTKTWRSTMTTTYRNRSSSRGTPKPIPTCPPLSIPKGGGGGGAPNQFPFKWCQSHGGGGRYWFYQFFFWGGGVKDPFLWYITSVPWPNQFSTHPYLFKQELQLCSSRVRFRDLDWAVLKVNVLIPNR